MAEVRIDLPHACHYRMKTAPEFSGCKAELTEQIRDASIKATQMAH